MNRKWLIVGGLIVVVFAYFLACFFGPASYKYSSEIKIDGPYKMAYIAINDIKDWPRWISWAKDDPGFKFSKGGREHFIGANFSFECKALGEGYVEIEESFQDSLVTAIMKSDKLPSKLNLNWQIIPEGTKSLFLKMNARIPGRIEFWKRAWYIGMPATLDATLQNDLEGIKTYIEQLVKTEFGIQKSSFTEKHYIGILDIIVNSKIPQYYAKSLPKVYKFLDSLGVKFVGPPVGLIFGWEAKLGQVLIMAALPVEKPMPNYTGYTSYTIKPTDCYKLENYGSYTSLRNAHTKLTYIMDNSPYILGAPIIEEYVTSPSQEPDTSKWLTNVYYLFDNTGGYAKSLERKYTLEDVIKMEEQDRRKNIIESLIR
ncbi:MAG: hypothetical protein IPM92_15100 [Saprospiraceae bacterium]|nr:hypothetical protein [Saprospiraceae bacterium]